MVQPYGEDHRGATQHPGRHLVTSSALTERAHTNPILRRYHHHPIITLFIILSEEALVHQDTV